jgi:nitroimidazol reductase NimA-like FMN-containing flavoprotein (pyridoxamine 5'-phosphate oxidase superfamily)
MEEIELATEVSNLLSQQKQCVLATMDETFPCQHLMAYAFSEDLFTIHFATYSNTRKFQNMQKNPNVSMMWDNRKGSIQDHVDGYSLTATGSAELLKGQLQEDARKSLYSRNSTLCNLLSSSNCRLISVSLEEYTLTKGYNHIFQFRHAP